MGSFSFNLPSGQKFEIKGPPNLTLEQAKAIFDKQVSSGSLVGFKPGDVLSASTQAASGLKSAQAMLNQAQSGIIGALGAGIPGSTGTIGQASSALAQAGGALNGSLSNIPGVNGAAGPAVGNLASGINQSTNLVTSSIQSINKAITTIPVTNPINAADFVKTLPALGTIGNMSQSTVTASMASLTNLTGQKPTTISNTGGVGSFGLDINQLEKAGIVKPGMAALATAAGGTVSSILKSPTAFTGKLGINNLGDLTKNPQAQSTIQQNLMAAGLKDLNTVGVPVKSLSASALAGVSAISAKSVTAATAYLKNLPIPGDATGSIKQGFDKIMRDGAFASNLAETKLPPILKAEVVPTPAENTTNRATVDAASSRIIGNDKVPTLDYGPPPTATGGDAATLLKKMSSIIETYSVEYSSVNSKVSALENQQTITDENWQTVRQELREVGRRFNTSIQPLLDEIGRVINRLPTAEKAQYAAEYRAIEKGSFRSLVDQGTSIINRMTALKGRIDTVKLA